MTIKVEVPEWTKAVSVTYVYYDQDGEGCLTMGAKGYAGKELDAIEIMEDDGK